VKQADPASEVVKPRPMPRYARLPDFGTRRVKQSDDRESEDTEWRAAASAQASRWFNEADRRYRLALRRGDYELAEIEHEARDRAWREHERLSVSSTSRAAQGGDDE
jgi:hypothetical protein